MIRKEFIVGEVFGSHLMATTDRGLRDCGYDVIEISEKDYERVQGQKGVLDIGSRGGLVFMNRHDTVVKVLGSNEDWVNHSIPALIETSEGTLESIGGKFTMQSIIFDDIDVSNRFREQALIYGENTEATEILQTIKESLGFDINECFGATVKIKKDLSTVEISLRGTQYDRLKTEKDLGGTGEKIGEHHIISKGNVVEKVKYVLEKYIEPVENDELRALSRNYLIDLTKNKVIIKEYMENIEMLLQEHGEVWSIA